jgi:hypothetical protein
MILTTLHSLKKSRVPTEGEFKQRRPQRFLPSRETACVVQWRTERCGLGGSNPPPKFRNFDEVPKIKKFYYMKLSFLYQITAASRTPD